MNNVINGIASHWFDWQFAMLWQTAVLIGILWLIDLAIRKWAWPQVRYALWMLVLVKLLIPPTWTSPASITSHIPDVVRAATVMERVSTDQQSSIASDTHVTPASEPQFAIPQPATSDLNTAPTAIEQSHVVPQGQNTIAANEIPGTSRVSSLTEPGGMASSEGQAMGSAAAPLQWHAYAMMAWLAGIMILTVWLLMRLSGLRREHINAGSGFQLPEQFHDQLQTAAAKLHLKRLPQVILTDKVAAPAVFGVVRPVLLIPRSTGILPVNHGQDGHATSTRHIEHILLHELAHIKRGDLLVHAVYMLLQIAYWFNPLLWLMRKTLQNLRELCCDATVAKLLREDTVHYRQTLLETARRLVAEPVDPGLGLLGLFENNNWLVTRLQWLEKQTWKNRPLRIATIILLVSVMTVCVLPMANRPPKNDTEGTEINHYKKILDNGITVELVAVSNYPSDGEQWWTPDGSPCSMSIETEDTNRYPADNPGYELVFRIGGTREPMPRLAVKGGNPQSGLTVKSPEGLVGWRTHFKAGTRDITAKLGILGDNWRTIATHSGRGTDARVIDRSKVVFSPVQQTAGGLSMTVSDDLDFAPAKRLVAVDQSDTLHPGRATGDLTFNGLHQLTRQFDGLDRDSIKEFQFQTQDYRWVTFNDVALRPIWQKEQVARLLDTLKTAEGRKRHDAAEKLVKYGRGVVPAITEMLQDDNVWAAYALGEIGPEAEDAVPALIHSLTHGGVGGVRGFSAAALGKIGTAAVPAIPALIETLRDRDEYWNTRMYAADSLGLLSTGQKEVIEALTDALQDKNEDIRKEAAWGLEQIKERNKEKKNQTHVQKEPSALSIAEGEVEGSEQSTTNDELKTNNYVATLPNGVTVELVGTCQYTEEGAACYRPDGTPLGRQMRISKWNQSPKAGDIGIMLRLDGPEDMKLSYHEIEGSKGWEGSCHVVDENGQELKGLEAALTRFDPQQETTSCLFGIASGTWKTIAKHDGKQIGIDNDISFTKANQTDKGVQIFTTDTLGRNIDQRIVAIDTQGNLHPWEGQTGSVRHDQLRQSIGTFPNLRVEHIKEFQFQTRSYEWVTFKNVALRPNSKTDVEIETDDAVTPNSKSHQFGWVVPFEITKQNFLENDWIEITQILGPDYLLKVGQTYTIKGKYKLSSCDQAMLHIYATNGEVQSEQGPVVERGTGEFTRTFTYLKEGWLHLSFYPADGGSSFGNLYFAEEGSNQQVPDMSQITSFIKTKAASGSDPIENSELKTENYIASLPNGVTVELLGVCEYPVSGKSWWDRSGNRLTENTGWHINHHDVLDEMKANECAYVFMVKAENRDTFSLSFDTVPESRISVIDTPRDQQGRPMDNADALYAVLPKKLETVDVHVGLNLKFDALDGKEPEKYIVFKNVALRPGGQTEVEVPSSFPDSLATSQKTKVLSGEEAATKGREILERLVETNRYWLKGPSQMINNYSYFFDVHIESGLEVERSVEVNTQENVKPDLRQGVGLYTVLHRIAENLDAVEITKVIDSPKFGIIIIHFKPKEKIKTYCGEGLSNIFVHHVNHGSIEGGSIRIDRNQMVPLLEEIKNRQIHFSEYIEVEKSHFVPLHITVEYSSDPVKDIPQCNPGDEIPKVDLNTTMDFDFRFLWAKEGLWLFDMNSATIGYQSGRVRFKPIVASTENIIINNRPIDKNSDELIRSESIILTHTGSQSKEPVALRPGVKTEGEASIDNEQSKNDTLLLGPNGTGYFDRNATIQIGEVVIKVAQRIEATNMGSDVVEIKDGNPENKLLLGPNGTGYFDSNATIQIGNAMIKVGQRIKVTNTGSDIIEIANIKNQ